MPTEARNVEHELMGVEGVGGGGAGDFHDHHMPDSPVSHDEGYFTSAVSVQHKVGSIFDTQFQVFQIKLQEQNKWNIYILGTDRDLEKRVSICSVY